MVAFGLVVAQKARDHGRVRGGGNSRSFGAGRFEAVAPMSTQNEEQRETDLRQKRERLAGSIKVLMELLELPCAALDDPHPPCREAAKRDADALAHAIKMMQGDPEAGCPWVEAAAQESRNREFYQGIVTQIGEMFGPPAYTSDDGSVQDSVLALKVPELVKALLSKKKKRV